MMKRITSFKTLLSMLAMVVMGSTVAVAENKVYISDSWYRGNHYAARRVDGRRQCYEG